MNVFTWNGQIDSKGRLTVPSEIRDLLDLEKGDSVSVSVSSIQVIRKEVENYQEAVELIKGFDSVKSFSFSDGILEAVINER